MYWNFVAIDGVIKNQFPLTLVPPKFSVYDTTYTQSIIYLIIQWIYRNNALISHIPYDESRILGGTRTPG
jgi:hypothetical protein